MTACRREREQSRPPEQPLPENELITYNHGNMTVVDTDAIELTFALRGSQDEGLHRRILLLLLGIVRGLPEEEIGADRLPSTATMARTLAESKLTVGISVCQTTSRHATPTTSPQATYASSETVVHFKTATYRSYFVHIRRTA